MYIPRVVETTLAADWTSPFTGTKFLKESTKIALTSALTDPNAGNCMVALPNPVPTYLDIAEKSLQSAKITRVSMFKESTVWPHLGNKVFRSIDGSEFDEFFQIVSIITTISFMALEAWCNQAIPEDYLFSRYRPQKIFRFLRKEEKLNKEKIERWVSLDEKLTTILPVIFSKPHFKGDFLWQRYKSAKEARDEFIHLKSPTKTGKYATNYDPFFQRVLNLDLDDIVTLPKDIMTYFSPSGLGF